MNTHYIEYFTQRDRWNQQRAACGAYVDVKAHTNEPTCPECQKYLAQQATLDAEMKATFTEHPTDISLARDPRR